MMLSDLSLRQLDYSFIEKYHFYLKIDCGLAPATIALKLIYLQSMIKLAIRKRIITHNPFAGFCVKHPKPTQKYVPMNEMQKLMKKTLNSNALEVTRDMFVFSCFTGLSHIDLYNLNWRQIEKDDDGFVIRLQTNHIQKVRRHQRKRFASNEFFICAGFFPFHHINGLADLLVGQTLRENFRYILIIVAELPQSTRQAWTIICV